MLWVPNIFHVHGAKREQLLSTVEEKYISPVVVMNAATLLK